MLSASPSISCSRVYLLLALNSGAGDKLENGAATELLLIVAIFMLKVRVGDGQMALA